MCVIFFAYVCSRPQNLPREKLFAFFANFLLKDTSCELIAFYPCLVELKKLIFHLIAEHRWPQRSWLVPTCQDFPILYSPVAKVLQERIATNRFYKVAMKQLVCNIGIVHRNYLVELELDQVIGSTNCRHWISNSDPLTFRSRQKHCILRTCVTPLVCHTKTNQLLVISTVLTNIKYMDPSDLYLY